MHKSRLKWLAAVSLVALGIAAATPAVAQTTSGNWMSFEKWPDFTTGEWNDGMAGGAPPPGTPGLKAASFLPALPVQRGALMPLNAATAARVAAAKKAAGAGGVSNPSCEPAGLVVDQGSKFFFGKGVIIIGGMADWYNAWRRVYMDRSTHGDDPEPSYFGDSIGHWEGDTLVIDTVAIRAEASLTRGVKLGDTDTHVIERYRLTGPDTLQRVVTVENPDLLVRPWTRVTIMRRQRGDEFPEAYCWKDRDSDLADGNPTPPP